MNFPFQLPDYREFDAVGFGLNAVDHLIVVPEYPPSTPKCGCLNTSKPPVVRLRHDDGFTTTRLENGLRGRFGSDAEGQFGFESLKSEGVNTEFAEVVAGARNQVAFIIVDSLSGERTIIWDRDEQLSYRADDAPIALVARGRVLHLDAHDPPHVHARRKLLARQARSLPQTSTISTTDFQNCCP